MNFERDMHGCVWFPQSEYHYRQEVLWPFRPVALNHFNDFIMIKNNNAHFFCKVGYW